MRFDELNGMYYPHGVLRPGDTMVEVGAYDGKRLRESELWIPGVTYHLFEPSPVLFPELCETFANSMNVKCHNEAIATESGPVTFYAKEPRGTGNGIYLIDGAEELTVAGLTIHDSFERYFIGDVRMMLVNCEGAEFDIFDAPLSTVVPVEWIVVSFHTDKHPMQHCGRECVGRDLAGQFETVAWFNEETRCQIWLGHNRRFPR